MKVMETWRNLLNLVLTIGVAVVGVACQTKRYNSFEDQPKFTGSANATTSNREFFIAERAQLASLNNPKDLQRWAVKLIARTSTNDMPYSVNERNIPLRQASDAKAIASAIHLEEANDRPCVTILMGGGGRLGGTE
jgi:hypothetical protein